MLVICWFITVIGYESTNTADIGVIVVVLNSLLGYQIIIILSLTELLQICMQGLDQRRSISITFCTIAYIL